MILFLKDQHSRTKERIVEISNSKELQRLYSKLENLELQIKALDTEINQSNEIEFLKRIIKETDNHKIQLKRTGIAEKLYDILLKFFDELKHMPITQ